MDDKIIIVGRDTEDAKQCIQILKDDGFQVELATVIDEVLFKKKFH